MKTKYIISDSGKKSIQFIMESMLILSGKWKIQIVHFLLINGNRRFMDIQRGIPGISSKILSKALQELQKDNIIDRIELKESPIAVEYSLTPDGQSLESVMIAIESWGMEHFMNYKTRDKDLLK